MTRILKQCAFGHRFYKSSDCESCPKCASSEKPNELVFAQLAAPARRALAHAGIHTLQDCTQFSEQALLALHGMGPKAMYSIQTALEAQGLQFKTE